MRIGEIEVPPVFDGFGYEVACGRLSPARIGEAAEAAALLIEPGGDIHATASYRRQLTRVLVTRALTQAAGVRAA